MLPPRRTQMDSLVEPLVAQYLAMGCQSKENQNESITADEKGTDDMRVTSGYTPTRSRVSPPRRPHRFHKPVSSPITPNKSIMSLGPLTKASWEELIQACLELFDADGCVRKTSHLLNITLTMHRLLMSSSDLLDKLINLYLLAVHQQHTHCAFVS